MTIQTNCEICRSPALGTFRCKVCRMRACPSCLIVDIATCKNCAKKL